MELRVTRLTCVAAFCLLATVLASGCNPASGPDAREATSADLDSIELDLTPIQPAPPKPVETERIEAGVGVGEKGNNYDENDVEMIYAPAKALFSAKEQIAFNIEIPKALQVYRALHDDKGPATHDAFMKDIIQAFQIKLPKLPAGHKYEWDPQEQQLMVERPVRKS